MPLGGTDTAIYDKFLKEFYLPGWSDLQNNMTTTKKLMRRRTVPFRGRRAIIALRTGRTGGIQSVAPSQASGFSGTTPTSAASTLPSPGFQQTDNAFIKPKILMLAIGVPQDTIDIASGDRASFMDVVDFEMMGAKADAANREDLLCYKGGAQSASFTGSLGLANIATWTDGTHFTVDNIYPFYKNQRLSFYTAAGAFIASSTILSITRSTRAIVLDVNGPTATTNAIALTGARPTTTTAANDLYSYEPWGLEAIVSTANPVLKDLDGNLRYLGIDRATQDQWQSVLVDCGGAFTYEKAQQVLDEIHDNSGGDATVGLTNRTTRRKVALKFHFGTATEAGLTQTRFNDSIRAKGGLVAYEEDRHGQEAVDWMKLNDEIPIILDRYATHDFVNNKGNIYFLDTRHWYEAVVVDWKWWAPEGRILREAMNTNQFGLQAHAYRFFERVCDAPNAQGRLYNISA